ncbi:pentapeptide repeat-containing protein [Neobacillus endophyticus]|uniref:pentapeptide repeat-containing protein n=1 Tax=Neobacillus endophyticus TaxID=2738405 RepID=UPI001C26F7A4|nr:pentapeptide repeat-containing protein [Neobacillus endophyticus]
MIEPDLIIENEVLNETIDLSEVEPGTVYKNCQITSTYRSPQIKESKFEHCEFLTEELNDIEMLDCIFTNCNLANIALRHAVVYRTIFESCKLLGNDFIGSKFSNVKFIDSHLRYINFSDSNLKSVLFENSDLTSAYFQEVKMKEVHFKRSVLNEVDFSDTNLKGIDLSNADFESIILTPNLLRGLKISSTQAPVIAALLGITVRY